MNRMYCFGIFNNRNNRILIFLICALVFAGCNRYIAYKTTVHDPHLAYEKMAAHWTRNREYVISVNGHEYIARNLTFDSVAIRAGGIQPGKRLFYHPEDSLHANSKNQVIRYDEAADTSALMNQVFIVADQVEQHNDSLVIPMASVKRIDVVKENHTLTILLVVGLLIITLLFVAAYVIEKEVEEEARKGCFIATACYGDYDAPEVLVFRHYRDQHLMKSAGGRLFIRIYYLLSPALARMISRSEYAKRNTRKYLLHPLLDRIRNSSVLKS